MVFPLSSQARRYLFPWVEEREGGLFFLKPAHSRESRLFPPPLLHSSDQSLYAGLAPLNLPFSRVPSGWREKEGMRGTTDMESPTEEYVTGNSDPEY
jgi:hypothetical protein